jgi:Holliday junction resolvase RusA-like endonuclease
MEKEMKIERVLENFVCLTIPTSPIAKARHRSRIVSNRIMTYDIQQSEKIKTKIDIAKQMKDKGIKPLPDAPISIRVINFTPMPKSWSKKRIEASEGKPCITRPDIDNYVKFYFDAMNGVVYSDDRLITSLFAHKAYSKNPRVEITLSTIG